MEYVKNRTAVSGLTVALTVLVIISIAISTGLGLYYVQQSSDVNQLQTKLLADETQISSLSGQIASLQSQVSNQESSLQSIAGGQQSSADSVSKLTSSIQTLQSSLQSLQSSLQSLQVQVQSDQSVSQSNSNQLAQVTLEIQNATALIASLRTDLTNLQPQIPVSTLVLVGNSFNMTANTETFMVKNTWNGTVNAQLQVTVMCITRTGSEFYCPNPVGSYTSNIMQFEPLATTPVSFNLSQVITLSSGTTDQLQIELYSSSTMVSPQYTLQYP